MEVKSGYAPIDEELRGDRNRCLVVGPGGARGTQPLMGSRPRMVHDADERAVIALWMYLPVGLEWLTTPPGPCECCGEYGVSKRLIHPSASSG